MVGILVSFWGALFSGAMLVSGRVKLTWQVCTWNLVRKGDFFALLFWARPIFRCYYVSFREENWCCLVASWISIPKRKGSGNLPKLSGHGSPKKLWNSIHRLYIPITQMMLALIGKELLAEEKQRTNGIQVYTYIPGTPNNQLFFYGCLVKQPFSM